MKSISVASTKDAETTLILYCYWGIMNHTWDV